MGNNYANKYFNVINEALNNSVYKLNSNIVSSEVMFFGVNELLLKVSKSEGRIFFLGNGASAAFANHMALDFSKNGKIISRSLSDSAMLTALANDYSYNSAMTEFLKIESVNSKDLIITISSSGNSGNIVNSLEYCKSYNIETLTLSGLKNDNKSIELSNNSIYVPMKTYGIVECVHQIFLHLILDNYMKIFEWDRETFQNMNHENFKI
jgi:D-sedoheptulose 7-phosphate isomerase